MTAHGATASRITTRDSLLLVAARNSLLLTTAHLLPRHRCQVGVANALSQRVAANGGKISEGDVTDTLKKIAVKLGGGRTVVSLFDVMPSRCVQDLTDIAQRFAKDL